MNKLLLIAAFFLGSQIFVSCSKNEASKTKEELLTMGGWRLDSKQTRISSSATWTDITSTIPACRKDDITSYTNPSGYTITEGASKCNAANPDLVATGSWALVNNKEDLKITIGASSITYNLFLVTENALTIDETDASGIVVTYNRYLYVH